MKIWNLVENIASGEEFLAEHGLSFYVETKKHKLLVDTGASDAFLKNAEKLGIDLKAVDVLILSHGHYDHGGGIRAFAGMNPTARIYVQDMVFEEYYHDRLSGLDYIGLDRELRTLPQIVVVSGDLRIDEELSLFANVTGRRMWPEGNRELKVRAGGALAQDTFAHEQYLVISCEGKEVLISGCAHNGILNILDAYRERRGGCPDLVISGFHMMKQGEYTKEEVQMIQQTARELRNMPARFATGHCTGERAYEILREIMGDQIFYVKGGTELRLDEWN